MFTVTERFRSSAPDARVGVLALSNVSNPAQNDLLEEQKLSIEQDLRRQYAGYDRPRLRELPVLQAYHQFYRRFDKTYHVQLQLESILFKGKSIPSVSTLVESMFMAELKNFLLTAGHDLDKVTGEIYADVALGQEQFTQLSGKNAQLKPGDMYITDASGILSSVIYGPDQRTAINPQTTRALFTVYAPSGIALDAIHAHLDDIAAFIRLFSPAAQTDLATVFP